MYIIFYNLNNLQCIGSPPRYVRDFIPLLLNQDGFPHLQQNPCKHLLPRDQVNALGGCAI